MSSAPVCRTPAEVAELRSWLIEQWAPGRPFANTAAASLIQRSPAEKPDPGAWALWEGSNLAQAELWWVGEDMVDLLLAASASVPDDALFAELEAVAPSGLVVFEKPWIGHDAEADTEIVVDALQWGPSSLPEGVRPGPGRVPCLSVSAYRRLDLGALTPNEAHVAMTTGAFQFADLVPVADPVPAGVGIDVDTGIDVAQTGIHLIADRRGGYRPRRADEPVGPSFQAHGCAWAPLGRSDWPTVDAIGTAPWPMTPTMLASFVEDRKIIAALWTLLHQEGITSRVEHRPPRATVRRAERAGIPRPLSTVQVVTLRRARTEAGEPTGARKVEHDHRWLVKGFWRWQAVGKGRTERRLTYVRPHIRGPEDKPLHVPERVNAWTR